VGHSVGFTILACLVLAGLGGGVASATGRKAPGEAGASTIKPRAGRSRIYRYPQRAPTRARYKEIQLALKQHGYNPGPIDGRWGSRTSRALKQFEQDHHLRADGKLDSLALITLGLGPKHLASIPRDKPKAATTEK